jgi:Beta-lactamase enzyme family/Bacterial tandem repeat domain 1
MLRRTVLALVASLAALAVSAPLAQSAAVDPERNLSKPTGWQWWKNRSEAQVNDLRSAGWRLTDVEVESLAPYRFTGAFVRNSGPYGRKGGWWYGKTADQVVALTKGEDRRLIDLEPYTVAGKRRFAIVTVRNEGEAAKGWWWNYDLTAAQVTDDINEHKIRLIDLDTYVVGGQRRYSYVGIKNTGVDARAWWWYHNVSPEFVQAKADEHKARLIDIEEPSKGKLTVVMVRNEGVYTRHAWGMSQSQLGKFVASNGVRITDVERNGNRWAAVMIDNVDAETARLRSIVLNSPYSSGSFGVFAKRVGGPTHVGLAHHERYQPMSVLKLVPHLYLMDRLDAGQVDLDADTIDWTAPAGRPDEVWCNGQGGQTANYSSPLRTVLRRALRESLNRAHESLLNTYGPGTMTARVQALGLDRTELYFGCKYPNEKDWLSNRSTLAEMGELFEGVETKKFFPHHWQQVRDEFYGLMASWPAEWFRAVVTDEAAKAGKSSVVNAFISQIDLKGKGGGVDSGNADGTWTTGRAFSYRVTFPTKVGVARRGGPAAGTIVPRAHVGGFFVNDMTAPCSEGAANSDPSSVSQECRDYAKAMGDTFAKLTAEAQRKAIREALATW